MNWYYKNGDDKIGPVGDKRIRELVELGKITPETIVWNELDAMWLPFGEASGKIMAGSLSDALENESQGAQEETAWEPYVAIEPSDTSYHDDSQDAASAPPVSESYCAGCFKKFPNEELVRYGAEKFCPACETLNSDELKKVAAAPRLPLAGFFIRLAAKLIDTVILGIIAMLLYASAVFLLLWTDAIFMSFLRMIILDIVCMLWFASFIGYASFFVGKYGATPGKLALGLIIVDASGVKVGYVKALGRSCSEILSAVPFALGYIVAAFDIEKRTLHDRICNTRVIKSA